MDRSPLLKFFFPVNNLSNNLKCHRIDRKHAYFQPQHPSRNHSL